MARHRKLRRVEFLPPVATLQVKQIVKVINSPYHQVSVGTIARIVGLHENGYWLAIHKSWESALLHAPNVDEERTMWFERHQIELVQ